MPFLVLQLDGLEAPEGSAQDVSDAESTVDPAEAAAKLTGFVQGCTDPSASQVP